MKTLFPKLKYYVGLALLGFFALSSLITLIPTSHASAQSCGAANIAQCYSPGASSTPNTGCPKNELSIAGACEPYANPDSNGNCPTGYTYAGNYSTCLSNGGASRTTSPSNNGTTAAGCPGSTAPGDYKCSTIPAGCPGSPINGPFSPTATVTCPYDSTNGDWKCLLKSCAFASGLTVTNGQTFSAAQTAAKAAANPPSQGDSLGCYSDANNLAFIMCPIIDLFEKGIQMVDDFITSALIFDTHTVFDPKNADGSTNTSYQAGYHQAWNSFRILSTVVLIIAGLVMVTSQAFGFEFLDAYTMKKVLPRLLVAVIGINLSWPLMQIAIEFFNTLGTDVRQIIYSPFSQVKGALDSSTLFVFGAGFLALIIALKGTILTFLATAGLAVLVGFLIIMVRYLAILVLIIFAPVAIACYVLPNTQKVWNLWRENFMGMLLVYPIISALIAIGHVFSAVSLANPDQTGPALSNTALQAIGFISYFLPYFVLPIAFRMATGVIGSLAGFVHNGHKGAFARLSKARSTAASNNWQKAKAGEYSNNRAINALTARATTSRFGLGKRGREAYDQKMAVATDAFGKSEKARGVMFKDNVLQAMSYKSEAEARNRLGADFGITDPKKVSEAIAGVKAAGGFGQGRSLWAAKQLAATGTGYEDEAQMLGTIARVSGGNKVVADSLWGEMRGTSERAGRNDLKASYGLGSDMLHTMIDQGAHRSSVAELRRNESLQSSFAEFGVDAARGVDNMQMLRGNKPKSIKNMMGRMKQSLDYHSERMGRQDLSADERRFSQVRVGQTRAKMENMEASTSMGPEVNAEAFHGARSPGTDRQGQPAKESFAAGRSPGYQKNGSEAVDAQEWSGLPGQGAYMEEHPPRQQYDPRTDPRLDPRNNQNHGDE